MAKNSLLSASTTLLFLASWISNSFSCMGTLCVLNKINKTEIKLDQSSFVDCHFYRMVHCF